MISLRPYQINVIARAQRCQRALVVMPTGSGKGVVGAEIIGDRRISIICSWRIGAS